MPEAMIVVQGKPIAQARPRFRRLGKFVKTYSSQETEAGRTYLEIKSQWKHKPLDLPLVVEMHFLFPVTKTSVKQVQAMLAGEIKHQKKPDLDNLAKFYLDCMSQLVFLDDKQVYELALVKSYAQEPQTLIKIIW